MFPFNRKRVEENARRATTDDLLERITIYRSGMEPEAIEIIEAELRRRGISDGEIARFQAEHGRSVLRFEDGTAATCSFCRRPAIGEGYRWHRLLGWLPVFPRYVFWCARHAPSDAAGKNRGEESE